MATTNYQLEAEVFGQNPEAHKLVQELLLDASKAYKYMDRLFGKKKYALHLKAASYNLNELSKMAGSLEATEEFIATVKMIYPNWEDAYTIIDAIIGCSKR